MAIIDWLESDRPRERLITQGPDKLSDAELLAILLRVGTKEKSAIDLARDLIAGSKGLRGLYDLSYEDFLSIKGMGSAKYAQLQAGLEVSRRILFQKMDAQLSIDGSAATQEYLMLRLRDKPYECFSAIFLNVRHQVITYQELFRGSINSATVPPREVVKEALKYNAASLIVAHNHPSGVAEPSAADLRLTARLKEALALVEVHLLDHIVVGELGCVSFAERGLM